jgi:hypothetical protein
MKARILLAILLASALAAGQPRRLPKLRVSENRRFLVTEDGKPFFWLADTAWELFHRLNREEAPHYLDTRARQGFNVVQAVALAELDGLTDPNPYGRLPLEDRDPARPAVTPGNDLRKAGAYDYWDHVDFIVDAANSRGIYVALLPTWGRWVKDTPTFTPEKAEIYGKWLGKRYKSKGIIWVLGGDRPGEGFEEIWRAMARGIAIGVSGKEDYGAVLMTYHPQGGAKSSTWFHNDAWLSFNMQQNGHGAPGAREPFRHIAADYGRTPVKPVLDGEPLYEDHPLGFRAKELGYSFDAHVRQYAYWDVFSGAFGHTYGNHAVWQMYAPGPAAGERPADVLAAGGGAAGRGADAAPEGVDRVAAVPFARASPGAGADAAFRRGLHRRHARRRLRAGLQRAGPADRAERPALRAGAGLVVQPAQRGR